MDMGWSWPLLPRWVGRPAWVNSLWLALLKRDRPPPSPQNAAYAAAGDNTNQTMSFEAFFVRHERPITNYLWRMTGNEQTASELAQETFLRAWQHFEDISHYEQPQSWLFRVATNLALQYRRRSTAPIGAAIALDADNDPASSDPTVHIVEQDLICQTLLQLPPRQRATLILREVHGLSCSEIGAILNCSRDAVKMALFRAREQFRQIYLRENEDVR